MNILLLTKKFPYPIKDGESLAILNLSKGLHALGCSVTLLAMNTSRHFYPGEKQPEELAYFKAIHLVPVDNRIRASAAFLNLFSSQSYHIQRFISSAYSQKLQELLASESFDVVQLETLYLTPYIPLIRANSQARLVMRAHNVEHEIWQRITENTTWGPKRWYLGLLSRKLRRVEVQALNTYDLLAAISSRDLKNFQLLGYQRAGTVVPIGIDLAQYQPDDRSYEKAPSLSFIGSLDWMPNLEGLDWFLKQVWETAAPQLPGLHLHVAGRNTPNWLHQRQQPQLHIYGEVPDAKAFINAHSVMVVPLHSGSGMRAKILEAMALGKVVLTTRLGLEGIDARPGEEVLVADEPEEFLRCLQQIREQPDRLLPIGQAARRFIQKNYDNQAIAQKLKDAYSKQLN